MQSQAPRPRILHLIDVAGTGGAETVFCQLAKHFDARLQNAMVILPGPGWIAEQLSSLQAPIEFVASKGSLSLRLLSKLAGLALRSGANVIVAHLLGSAVYSAALGLILDVPVIAIFHGTLDFSEPGRMVALKRWLLRRSHVTVIAVSDGVRDALAQWGLPKAHIHLIRNGIDVTAYERPSAGQLRSELGLNASARIVGAVGNLHPVKGYELMLRAASVLVAAEKNVIFAVAGEGESDYRASLEALRDELHLGDRFRFLGFKPAGPDLYASLDLLISSASSEGLPLSFLEAMICGVPIVATANEGSTKLLSETGCGLLVTDPTPEKLADAMRRVLLNDSLYRQFADSGRRAVLSNYNIVTTLEAYDRLIDSAVAERQSG